MQRAAMQGKTRTALFTEHRELLPEETAASSPSPERLAAFQKKFEIKDKDLAAQLIYALEGSSGADERVGNLEQLVKDISAAGHEDSKLEMLFRLLDVERTGIISASGVDQQLKKVHPELFAFFFCYVRRLRRLSLRDLIALSSAVTA